MMCTMSFDGSPIRTISFNEELRYDREKGEMQTLIDGEVRSATLIRAGLEDKLLLAAVVIELERRGYTVLAP